MSATTGDLSDNHDIVSIKTYELDTPASVSREERADILPEVAFSTILRQNMCCMNCDLTMADNECCQHFI